MTPAQEKALDILSEVGTVFAGYNVTKAGSQFLVNAMTLKALERMGVVELKISPDGGMMAVKTKAATVPW
jgi:hypothetical protein